MTAKTSTINTRLTYAQAYRSGVIHPLPAFVRKSGRVMGHAMYVRSEGRFQVDLVDDETREKRTLYVPAVIQGTPSSLDRTVAFREAIRLANWRTRAQRRGKRIIVRKAASRRLSQAA